MTKSDVFTNAKQTSRRTEPRYAGNCDVRQAFFFLFLKELVRNGARLSNEVSSIANKLGGRQDIRGACLRRRN
jgi:hypothetical protein